MKKLWKDVEILPVIKGLKDFGTELSEEKKNLNLPSDTATS